MCRVSHCKAQRLFKWRKKMCTDFNYHRWLFKWFRQFQMRDLDTFLTKAKLSLSEKSFGFLHAGNSMKIGHNSNVSANSERSCWFNLILVFKLNQNNVHFACSTYCLLHVLQFFLHSVVCKYSKVLFGHRKAYYLRFQLNRLPMSTVTFT